MVARAVAAQYEGVSAIEHVYPLVRSPAQLERVISEIEQAPGIVLYTLVEADLSGRLEQACRATGSPHLSVLAPVHTLIQSYLGAHQTARPGAQHMLNADYFKRIDAMNFTLMHDDGQLPADLNDADVVLIGISRTSKTPTAIYLANRGVKTANIPLVPNVPVPQALETVRKPLVVGLVATPERIVQIRQNRLLSLKADNDTDYVDRDRVAEEVAFSRRLCARHNWPIIDVTRRSIEETAAAILDLYRDHRMKFIAVRSPSRHPSGFPPIPSFLPRRARRGACSSKRRGCRSRSKRRASTSAGSRARSRARRRISRAGLRPRRRSRSPAAGLPGSWSAPIRCSRSRARSCTSPRTVRRRGVSSRASPGARTISTALSPSRRTARSSATVSIPHGSRCGRSMMLRSAVTSISPART